MKKTKLTTLRTLKTKLKTRGKKRVVFTNGCFDILHVGHVRYLRAAAGAGDLLVVGLNSDKSVRKIKGKGRPVMPQAERAEMLSALEFVDFVVLFDEVTPIKLIEALSPDILAKGADWKEADIVGADIVKAGGGRVKRLRLAPGRSTTSIIKKIEGLKRK